QLVEALKELRLAVQLGPTLARSHYYYAEALTQAGQRAGALEQYKEAARLSPRDAEFLLKYGSALLDTSPAESAVILSNAAQLDGKNPEILTALAMALRKSGKAQEAAAMFQKSREASRAMAAHSEAVLQTNRAIDFLKHGQVNEAAEALQAALKAEPGFAEANEYMGITQSALGNWRGANQAFQTALQVSPSDPDIHLNYGVSLEKQREWLRAATEFESVLSLRPGHPQAACRLADALERAGDTARIALAKQQARQAGGCDVRF